VIPGTGIAIKTTGTGYAWDGLDRVMGWFVRRNRSDAGRVEKLLSDIAAQVYHESQILVPLDKGPLRASGRIEKEGTGLSAVYFVLYGSDAAKYAVYVHEDLTKAHKAPTCAKFVTKAMAKVRRRVPVLARAAFRSRITKPGFNP